MLRYLVSDPSQFFRLAVTKPLAIAISSRLADIRRLLWL